MTIGNNDIVRAASVWAWTGTAEMVNTLHLKIGVPGAQTQTDIRTAIENYLVNAYQNITAWMTAALVHARVELFNVTDQTPETWIGNIALIDGASGGEALPPQVSAEVFFRTGVSRHIGRIFIPTFAEGAQAGGDIVIACRNDLADFGADIAGQFTDANGVTVDYVVYDRSAGVGRPAVGYTVPLEMRTQRRRRRGVGT